MNNEQLDNFYMQIAINEANIAKQNGDVPCGAVIVLNNKIIAKSHNQIELLNDSTAHAEMLAITQASQSIGNWRLEGCTMYVTKEPCVMCAGAIVFSRIKKVVWGMTDINHGGASSKFEIFNSSYLNHKVMIKNGILEDECSFLMKSFFQNIRKKNKI